MNWSEFDPGTALRIIGVGVTVNVACAILGCYLVLRRMSLLGDAISHAILPGLAVAFLLSGTLGAGPMFVGAMVVGMLTAALARGVTELANVSEDTSLGVVFTGLFAIGVVLLNAGAGNIDLDPDCVFNGRIEFAGIDTVTWGSLVLPRPLAPVAAALVGTLALVIVFWKELKLTSFDPAFATSAGLRAGVVHYLLMAAVAGTTVASFEAVGSILVVAMLIVPPSTAHLLTDRLAPMLIWSAVLGATAAVLGVLGAWWLDVGAAGMMAVVAGLQFVAVLALAPRHGLIGRTIVRRKVAARIADEDALTRLYRAEVEGRPAADGRLAAPAALARLQGTGEIESAIDGVRLTTTGRDRAKQVLRAHRLWEQYLDEHFQLPRDHLHESAERVEHFLGPDLVEKLDQALDRPRSDPHGRPIPGDQDQATSADGAGAITT